MNQLKEMFEWLRHPYCKREKILSYFQEKLHKPVAHCCDFCGIHLTDYESEHGLRTMKRPANWQDKLAQLLGLEEKSLNDTESSKGID